MRTTLMILFVAAVLGVAFGVVYEACTDAPRGVMDY